MNNNQKNKNPYLNEVDIYSEQKQLSNEEIIAKRIKTFAQSNDNSKEEQNSLASIFKQAFETDEDEKNKK